MPMFIWWKPDCLQSWTRSVLRCWCRLLDLEDADVHSMKASLLTILNKISLKMQSSGSWRHWCSDLMKACLLTILNKLGLKMESSGSWSLMFKFWFPMTFSVLAILNEAGLATFSACSSSSATSISEKYLTCITLQFPRKPQWQIFCHAWMA